MEKGEGGEKRTENGADRGGGSMNVTGVNYTTAHLATWKSRRRGAWLKVWPTPSLDLDMTPTDGAAPSEKKLFFYLKTGSFLIQLKGSFLTPMPPQPGAGAPTLAWALRPGEQDAPLFC